MKLIKSPLNALLNQKGIPTLADGGTPPKKIKVVTYKGGSQYATNPLSYAEDNNWIDVYRHDPKGKHGGKEGLETVPTKLNADQLTAYAKALRDAKVFGGKTITPEQLMTMALIEGRSDFGYDDVDVNNKRATTLANKLIDAGHNADAAGFAAAIDNKLRTADRLGIPFGVAWNGAGRGAGGTGRDYQRRFDAAHNAGIYEHPKNANLFEAVQNGFLAEPEQVKMPEVDVMGNVTGMKKGGSVAKQKAFLKFHKK